MVYDIALGECRVRYCTRGMLFAILLYGSMVYDIALGELWCMILHWIWCFVQVFICVCFVTMGSCVAFKVHVVYQNIHMKNCIFVAKIMLQHVMNTKQVVSCNVCLMSVMFNWVLHWAVAAIVQIGMHVLFLYFSCCFVSACI